MEEAINPVRFYKHFSKPDKIKRNYLQANPHVTT